MEEKSNRPGGSDAEFVLDQVGRAVQFVIQAAVFIVCGTIVVIWEGFSRFFQTVYDKGTQCGMDLVTRTAPAPPPEKIKVRVLPIDNYSQLAVDQIISRLEGLSAEDLMLIKNFEMGQQNRSALLEAIDKRLGGVR